MIGPWNQVSLVHLRGPVRPRRRPHEPATVDKMRQLVERTTLSYREIGARTGASAATVSRHARRGPWVRPHASPPAEPYTEEGRRLLRRRGFAERLMRQAERHIFDLEMNPTASPRAIQRALRLARLAASFDALDQPPRKSRRKPRTPPGAASA